MTKDIIQERLSHYNDKFNTLVMEIEKDSILQTMEGNHLAGVLTAMKNQIEEYLEDNLPTRQ